MMTPQKNGYTSKCWYGDKEELSKFDFSKTTQHDVIPYAEWEENKTGKDEITLKTNTPQITQLINRTNNNDELLLVSLFCGSAISISLVGIYIVMKKRKSQIIYFLFYLNIF